MSAGSRGSGSPRKSCPTRNFTPTISPFSGKKVVGSIHMSWANSGVKLSAAIAVSRLNMEAMVFSFEMWNGLLQRRPFQSVFRMLWSRDVRLGRNVDTTVSLQQTLVGRSQEREPVEIILVVD